MLSVTYNTFMLSVVMLNVVLLIVVAPCKGSFIRSLTNSKARMDEKLSLKRPNLLFDRS